MTLDEKLGLKKNPFSLKSSEQELEFLGKIFHEPNYYKTLINDLSNGVSLFIIGQRGHGKSSIINKLVEDLEKIDLLTIKIDRFDSIPIKKNETALIKLILKCLVTKLLNYLHGNRSARRKLNKFDKDKLALFHRLFYGTLSRSEYKSVYNNFHKIKRKNLFIKFFNKIGLIPVNTVLSAASNVASNTIRQSIGSDIDTHLVYKEYFGEIDEVAFEKLDIDKEHSSKDTLKQILDDVLIIIKKVGFKNTVVLFDKIDEFQDINQDINQIANFTKEILSDTELLMNEKFAIGFSLWSELKSELEGKVRFDKFNIIDVRWGDKDLIPLINKRISHFSINDGLCIEKIIIDDKDLKDLIYVANKSPRDLISALSEVYREQSNTNQDVNSFETKCITSGLINFCSKHDYDSIIQSKAGKNKEIKAMINRLLAIKLNKFTTKDLTDTFRQTNAQSLGQIKIMIDYKLIAEEEILGPGNYEVSDPKVEY